MERKEPELSEKELAQPESVDLISRIPDPFFGQLVVMYRERAKYWRAVSIALLATTFIFVICGVVVFLLGDFKADMQTEREVELLSDIVLIQKEISNVPSVAAMDAELSVVESSYKDAQKLPFLLKNLTAQKDNFLSGKPTDSISVKNLKELKESTEACLPILKTIAQLAKTIEDESTDLGDAANGILKTSDKRANFLIFLRFSNDIDWQETLASVDSLAAILNRPEGDIVLSEFREAVGECLESGVKNFALLSNQIGELKSKTTKQKDNERGAYPERKKTLEDLEASQRLKMQELDKEKDARNYLLFMAWVPDLTLRVGAVILLLFLTKILLVTYRYTVSLSSFYLAVGDAIQLLQPTGDGARWYRIEHLSVLIGQLTPRYGVDSLSTPTDQLGEMVKAWVENGKGT